MTSSALQIAAAHFQAGRLGQAEVILRDVLSKVPDNPIALHLLGIMAYKTGRFEDSLQLIEGAIKGDANNPAFHTNLGLAYEAVGRFQEAITAHERSLALRPGYAQAWVNLGQALAASGDHLGAEQALRKAIGQNAYLAPAWNSLAGTLKATGRHDEAIMAYRRAIEIRPNLAAAHANLGLAIYQESDPAAAAACLEKALRLNPRFGMAAFYLATIRDRQGEIEAAERLFDQAAGAGAIDQIKDSWDYVKANREPETRLLTNVFETLEFALERAQVKGLVLEFGVRFGISIRFLASQTAEQVHGFDSFEGLPESWGNNPAGVYSTSGKLPDVPSNVRLHVGWFEETLPDFLVENEGPVRFINVDCDIYSSTKTIFDHLAGRIVAGSVIVFDEYIMTGGWREDEYKAFQEAVDRHGWRYRYLAFSLITRQAVVEIFECGNQL